MAVIMVNATTLIFRGIDLCFFQSLIKGPKYLWLSNQLWSFGDDLEKK